MRFELFREDGILKMRDLNRPRYKPIYVDFFEYFHHWEKQKNSLKKTLLAKAIGYKGEKLKILDATLGLSKDAFFFCLLGCDVVGTEKSEIVYALVEDALIRARENSQVGAFMEHLKIQNCDVRTIGEGFDVVYIDPMYPDTKSSAAPQASMQILRDLLAPQNDTQEILNLALKNVNLRAVVKRPPKAPVLQGSLIHSYVGKAVRYDAYRPQTGLGS